MNKKHFLLFIVIIFTTVLIGCSNINNSEKVNVNFDKLKFNEETGDSVSSEFGVIFYDFTCLSIEWYNTYIDNSKDEKLNLLCNEMFTATVEDMQDKFLSGSLNEYEQKIYNECLKLSGGVSMRTLKDSIISKEELLREKNLKEMDDEEFEKLKNNRKQNITLIKENLVNILEKYYKN